MNRLPIPPDLMLMICFINFIERQNVSIHEEPLRYTAQLTTLTLWYAQELTPQAVLGTHLTTCAYIEQLTPPRGGG